MEKFQEYLLHVDRKLRTKDKSFRQGQILSLQPFFFPRPTFLELDEYSASDFELANR